MAQEHQHQPAVWQQPAAYIYSHPVDYGALHYPGMQFPFVPAAQVPLISGPAAYATPLPQQPPIHGGRSGPRHPTHGRGRGAGRSADDGRGAAGASQIPWQAAAVPWWDPHVQYGVPQYAYATPGGFHVPMPVPPPRPPPGEPRRSHTLANAVNAQPFTPRASQQQQGPSQAFGQEAPPSTPASRIPGAANTGNHVNINVLSLHEQVALSVLRPRTAEDEEKTLSGALSDVPATHSRETLSTLDVQLSSPSIGSGWPRAPVHMHTPAPLPAPTRAPTPATLLPAPTRASDTIAQAAQPHAAAQKLLPPPPAPPAPNSSDDSSQTVELALSGYAAGTEDSSGQSASQQIPEERSCANTDPPQPQESDLVGHGTAQSTLQDAGQSNGTRSSLQQQSSGPVDPRSWHVAQPSQQQASQKQGQPQAPPLRTSPAGSQQHSGSRGMAQSSQNSAPTPYYGKVMLPQPPPPPPQALAFGTGVFCPEQPRAAGPLALHHAALQSLHLGLVQQQQRGRQPNMAGNVHGGRLGFMQWRSQPQAPPRAASAGPRLCLPPPPQPPSRTHEDWRRPKQQAAHAVAFIEPPMVATPHAPAAAASAHIELPPTNQLPGAVYSESPDHSSMQGQQQQWAAQQKPALGVAVAQRMRKPKTAVPVYAVPAAGEQQQQALTQTPLKHAKHPKEKRPVQVPSRQESHSTQPGAHAKATPKRQSAAAADDSGPHRKLRGNIAQRLRAHQQQQAPTIVNPAASSAAAANSAAAAAMQEQPASAEAAKKLLRSRSQGKKAAGGKAIKAPAMAAKQAAGDSSGPPDKPGAGNKESGVSAWRPKKTAEEQAPDMQQQPSGTLDPPPGLKPVKVAPPIAAPEPAKAQGPMQQEDSASGDMPPKSPLAPLQLLLGGTAEETPAAEESPAAQECEEDAEDAVPGSAGSTPYPRGSAESVWVRAGTEQGPLRPGHPTAPGSRSVFWLHMQESRIEVCEQQPPQGPDELTVEETMMLGGCIGQAQGLPEAGDCSDTEPSEDEEHEPSSAEPQSGGASTAADNEDAVAAMSAVQGQQQQQAPRKQVPRPSQESLHFEASVKGPMAPKEAANRLVERFQQHGSVMDCCFDMVPSRGGKVRLLGWVSYRGSSRGAEWLQDTAARVQHAQPEDYLRVSACRMQHSAPRRHC